MNEFAATVNPVLCACGCGEPAARNRKHKHGHAPKRREHFCRCGCGRPAKFHGLYFSGHEPGRVRAVPLLKQPVVRAQLARMPGTTLGNLAAKCLKNEIEYQVGRIAAGQGKRLRKLMARARMPAQRTEMRA